MSYQALARKWRPKNFPEVAGQEHVVAALSNGLDSRRIHHAFLFAGTRGVGKTTLARIFAKALNCEQGVSSKPCGECTACRGIDQGNFIDLIEVDAASRTKVDDTRELLDNVQYTPAQGRYKVYLIDEVHMLSNSSFNALLKTLEEPPPHVKFLLATTDPQKLLPTVLSRCIQFNLKAMEPDCLLAQLEKILTGEKIKYDEGAIKLLARAANGSVRDALSLLDQGIAFGNGEVRAEKMRAMLGMLEDHFVAQLLAQIFRAATADALQTIDEMARRAADFSLALDELLTMLHNLALYQAAPAAAEGKSADLSALAELAGQTDAETLQLIYQIALIAKRDLPYAPEPRSGFEMAVLRMIAFRPAAAPAPTGGANTTPATPPRAATPAQSAAQPNITLAQLTDSAHWGQCLAQLGLRGVAREMMLHTQLQSAENNTLNLVLDRAHENLLDVARVKKIAQRFSELFAREIKLNFTVGEVAQVATTDAAADANHNAAADKQAAAQNQTARDAKIQAAREEFGEDPTVQELKKTFDAEIVDESIRPPA